MMNRLKGLLARLNNRWTIRILLVSLVTATGTGAGYLGLRQLKGSAKAPTKKIVTGVAADDATGAAPVTIDANVVPASATSDAPAQPASTPPSYGSGYAYGGGYGSGGYGAESTTDTAASPAQPSTNPYSAGLSDDASATPSTAADQAAPYKPPVTAYGGGSPYSGSPYNSSPAYGAGGAATTDLGASPDGAQPPATQPPTNPYRADAGASASLDPTAITPQDPNMPVDAASGADASANAITPPTNPLTSNPYSVSPATPQPAADPADAYAQKFSQNESPTPIPSTTPAATPATNSIAPPPTMPPATTPAPFAAGAGTAATAGDAMSGATPQPLSTMPSSSTGSQAGIAPLAPRSLGGPTTVAGEGVGVPGDRQFEGPQSPSLVVQKSAPAEIQIGKPATFEIHVRNAGQVAAQHVVVTDQVPRGTTLIEASPEAGRSADGGLQWELGTLQPGAEVTLQMQLMPQSEGEIGSVAQVTFAAQASARTVCTRPLLAVEHTAPPKIMIGQQMTMAITVSNPGTGAATGVVVEEDVPEGLAHVAGSELEYEIGVLRPGESKRLELILKADKPGVVQNTIIVRGEGNLTATHQVQIEVVAPQLQVGVDGPKKRFLQRQATYTVSVANPGTAAARDVELVAYLPRGMKFVDTDSEGQYDPRQHAVFWSLEELPAAKTGSVKLVALPIEPGEQRLRVEGRAELGLATANEQIVQVDAAAELVHTVQDLSDPIEVGTETVYEVRVKNVGTKTATNVRIGALAPAGMKMIGGDGPTRGTVEGQRVVFEPVARLNPQEEAVFKVQVQGVQAGDHLVRVQIASDEWPTPVSREESTRVYEDR